jgi:arylsulfatase A-like enzyme
MNRSASRPNVVFVFADQWRAQATGYGGDPNVKTPVLDELSTRSVNLVNAVAGCPVCSPYRASLMTGQFPLTHGVFVNDVCLTPSGTTIAEAFAGAGYDTAYIGKWHIDGHGRSAPIPKERRHGFDYWKTLECTHDYQHSAYYDGDSTGKSYWPGYDATAQTFDACSYIRRHGKEKPYFLVLSFGPPHDPYDTAPEEYRSLYDPDSLELPSNVPPEAEERARSWLAGYYAHCTALDDCVGRLLATLRESGDEERTLFVFTSDHGDMLGSHGEHHKQRPWDESVRVPFLLRYPGMESGKPRRIDFPFDAPDIMPTLLGLCGIPIPATVEGRDLSRSIAGAAGSGDHDAGAGDAGEDDAAFLLCPHPFGQWTKSRDGGREYRGIRTRRYTWIRDLDGPWLLYDNIADPHQLVNLVDDPSSAELRERLDSILSKKLAERGDRFLPGMSYIEQWGYEVDERGTVPYTW